MPRRTIYPDIIGKLLTTDEGEFSVALAREAATIAVKVTQLYQGINRTFDLPGNTEGGRTPLANTNTGVTLEHYTNALRSQLEEAAAKLSAGANILMTARERAHTACGLDPEVDLAIYREGPYFQKADARKFLDANASRHRLREMLGALLSAVDHDPAFYTSLVLEDPPDHYQQEEDALTRLTDHTADGLQWSLDGHSLTLQVEEEEPKKPDTG